MANSHILIAASVTSHDGDEEGMPIALEEAMAQGWMSSNKGSAVDQHAIK
jgi:hypothetical protein